MMMICLSSIEYDHIGQAYQQLYWGVDEVEIDKDLIEQIIEHYGYDAQKRKIVEELLELGQAILKDTATGKNLEQIHEELADVEIMLEQLKTIYQIDNDKLRGYKQEKLMRIQRILRQYE